MTPSAIRALREQVEAGRKDAIRAEVDSLVSAIYGGVTVIPSDMVQKTTILVRPDVYAALLERVEFDAEARALEEEAKG